MPDARQHSFIQCEAVKVGYTQTAAGYKITFSIHPDRMPPELANAKIGTRVLLAVAEMTDQTPDEFKAEPERVPVPPRDPESIRPPAKSEKAKAAYQDLDEMAKAVVRAAMMCQKPTGQDWLLAARSKQIGIKTVFTNESPVLREHMAAASMQLLLGIESRSEIGTDERAFLAFKRLEDAYHLETKYAEQLNAGR